MEKNIKIAAKFYECRNTAKKLYKKEYAETLKPYIEIIKMVMKAEKKSVLEALLKISETKTYNQDSGMGQMLFMAAGVEILELSIKN